MSFKQLTNLHIFILSVFVLCLANSQTYAQVTQQGEMPSNNYELSKNIPVHTMPAVDNQNLIENEDPDRRIPPIGHVFNVDIGLEDGKWESLSDGHRVWRTKIISNSAIGIRFVFDQFELPVGAELYIYNEDKSTVLGALTAFNNQKSGKLGTEVLRGDRFIIELYEPRYHQGETKLNISKVSHIYKNIFGNARLNKSQQMPSIQDSEYNCPNENAECADDQQWGDARRATVKWTFEVDGSTSSCSGVMINAVDEQFYPYMLTAHHCIVGVDLSTITTVFDHQSTKCSQDDPATTHSISGADLKAANDQKTDYALLELGNLPDDSWNVWMAGWSRSTNVSEVGIFHHPLGDLMEFAHSNNMTTSSIGAVDKVWDGPLNKGRTEGGSSGAPYFNSEGKVIGQHYGATDGTCGNQTVSGGRFDVSWDASSSTGDKLKDFLDPNNTNQFSINGDTHPGLEAVSNFTVSGSTHPQFSWNHNPSSIFSHYVLYRRLTKPSLSCGPVEELIASQTSKTYTDYEVDISGTTCNYYYYVQAVAENGYRSPSKGKNLTGFYVGPKNKDIALDKLKLEDLLSNFSNYPNPFNPSTTIRFTLAAQSDVTLTIYGLNGQKVRSLVNSSLEAGVHSVSFNGQHLSSGIYFANITINNSEKGTLHERILMNLIK